MREQLINLLVQKVGLSQQQAGQCVDTIVEYFKNNPDQVKALLSSQGQGGLGGIFKR